MMRPELKVEMMRTGELVPYAGNAKKHPEWQVEQIRNSIEAFGFNDPIAVWRDIADHWIIVEGHGRLLAAKELGMEEVPVIRLDHLDDEARRAYTLAHNKLTMNTDFDFSLLDVELDAIEGFDMSEFGFEIELPRDLNAVEDAPVPEKGESVVKAGEVWKLGRHRLMCGDSTDAKAVAKLMDGGRADACFTSPPYNMGRSKVTSVPSKTMNGGDAYGLFSDDLTDGEYADLLCSALDNALAHSDDALFNIGILSGSKQGIAELLDRNRDRFCDIVVWRKDGAIPLGFDSQYGQLSHICELVFCFNAKGTRNFSHPQWAKGDLAYNLIETANNKANKHVENRAAFPIEFAAEALRRFTGSSVIDLFGGTGTTLMAAEQLGRTCYMMELDPDYCDIIIKRWEDYTGMKAEKCA